MKYTDIVSNPGTVSKAVWLVFSMCTVLMFIKTVFSSWPVWVYVVLVIHELVLSIMTFHPKIPVRAQSVIVMLFTFSNIFICSLMVNNIFITNTIFMAAGILIAAYKKAKLVLAYSLLVDAGIIYHIAILKSIPFDSSVHITEFIVRISVMLTAQIFLMIFIRSMEKNEQELKKSIAEARQAERYKSDFLANMSHEIRTPMNAIVGMCELILREDGLRESVRENCFNIQTSGRSLLAIINDILDFSKIESGKLELIPDEFNIASTLNTVINMSEARRGDKKIDILVNVDPDIPRGIIADEVRIRQIIVNLMTNAIKFTHKGSVTLTVSHTKQDYGINLFVSVADTGIGITEENIEKLFTSFRQVDTKKNRSVEGTGLGLAISKRLVGQMGGFISVKSEYGVGSEFRFVIPVRVSDERPFITIKDAENIHAVGFFNKNKQNRRYEKHYKEMGEQLHVDFTCCTDIDELKKFADSGKITHFFAAKDEYIHNADYFAELAEKSDVYIIQERTDAVSLPDNIRCLYKPFYAISVASVLNNENIVLNMNERRGAEIRFSAPKARVLIVDDNPINLKVAVGLMQPYHMQLMTAESGAAAIKMLRSKDIDLVFMDHMMPEMDGVEATKIIRETEGEYYKKLPIIALTANAVNGVREMFIKEGLNDFLAKPIELTALDRILRSYLPKQYIQAPVALEYAVNDRRQNTKKPDYEGSAMFDPDKGLMYMGGNIEPYREILELYAKKGPQKRKYIDALCEKKDWKNYIIEVHALKSTSMSIGAIRLSELAKELEAAGKSENYSAIEKKNGALSDLYGEIIDIVNDYLGKTGDENDNAEETAELAEISADMLSEYISRAKQACGSFDADAVSAVAKETSGYSYKGTPLNDYFRKAAELAEDFEYDAATEVIAELEASVGKEER